METYAHPLARMFRRVARIASSVSSTQAHIGEPISGVRLCAGLSRRTEAEFEDFGKAGGLVASLVAQQRV